tara:strand:+ start:2679 stop:3173 length:495 start_codon:yes stop_codon:yes gene_type:complete
MALKADRYEESTDISFFYNEGTATRGGVVILADLGLASGAALDQGENLVKYGTAVATDVPVGILLNDVVNKDLTRTHLNQHKDEVQKGGKVTVMTRGWVVTNNIEGTPVAGELAFASPFTAGAICNGTTFAAQSGELAIGRFMSRADGDGYAKVYVNLPNAYGS